jgi:hypothetical protein
MSWSELERLVETAERDPALARALGHCRSAAELVLAARRLGYGVSSADLADARAITQGLPPVPARPLAGPQLFPTPGQRIRESADSDAAVTAAALTATTAPRRPGSGLVATVNHSLAS